MSYKKKPILRVIHAVVTFIVAFTMTVPVNLLWVVNAEASTSERVVSVQPLNVPRVGHTAVVLADGRVLVAGGENAGGVLDSVEIFALSANSFVLAGNLTIARTGHTATLLSDGRVLIAGGHNSGGPLDSAEIYDPATQTSEAIASLTSPRDGHTATRMLDGKVLLAGGNAAGTAELFDPATGTFTLLGALAQPRTGHSATLFADNSVLLAGGGNNTAEYFDPTNLTFTLVPQTMSTPRTDQSALATADEMLLLVGGDTANTIERFDPTTDTFTVTATLSNAVATATLLANEKVLVLGPDGAGVFAPTGTNQWEALTDASAVALLRAGQTASELPANKRILVVGGVDGSNQFVGAAALFNPAWVATDIDDYPPDGMVYVTGGGFLPNETVGLDVLKVDGPGGDTVHDTWTTQADAQGELYDVSWQVCGQDCVDALLHLTATGQTSGLTAQTAFTDAILAPVPIGNAGYGSASYVNSLQVSVTTAVAVNNTVIIAIVLYNNQSPTVTVTDGGNTYTKDADITNASLTRTLVFSARVTTALTTSSKITVNLSSSAQAINASAFYVSGLVASSPVDKTATATGTGTTPSVGPTATTTQANELLIGAFGLDVASGGGTPTFTAGANYTALPRNVVSGVWGVYPEYRIVSATGAYSANGTWSGGVADWAAAIVAYKAAPSAANSTISASPTSLTADGTTTTTITVTAKDDNNNPISGIAAANVVVAATGTGNTLVQPTTATDANGQTTATLKSTVAEAKTVSVTILGTPITQTAPVTFTAGSATKLAFTAVPGSGTAGTPFSVTVQSQDANGNPVNLTSDTTITLSKASGAGTLSGTLTGTISTGANSVTISTPVYSKADTMTLTATASGGVTLTAATSPGIVFSGGAATQLAYTTVPSSGTAGTAFSVTVQSQDANGNPANLGTATTITLSKATGGGTLGGTLTGSIGSGANSVTISTPVYSKADTMTLTATATAGMTSLSPVTSGNIVFSAGAANAGQSTVAAAPTSVTADGATTSTITVTLNDANNNPVSGKTVTLTKTSGPGTPTISAASGASDASGVVTFTVKSTTAGADAFTAADTTDSVTVTQTATVTFTAGALDHFAVTTPATQTAGTAFAIATITAQDVNNNTVTGFTGTVDLTETGGGAGGTVNPSPSSAFTAGVLSGQSVTLTKAGTLVTITATDHAGTGKTGVSGTFTVNAGTATKFVITGSATQTAGTSQNLTITALDAGGNTATGYTGSKSLTFSGANSSPSPVTVPTVENSAGTPVNFGTATAITFSSGVATVSAGNNGVMVLYKAESATISVTDGTINSSSGGNLAVTVNPAALGKFAFALATPQINAAAFTGVNTLTAQDNWGNTVTTFDASASNVTITGVSPLTGTVSGLGTVGNNVLNKATDFSFGVANLTALGLTYTGVSGTGTFTATSAGKTGTSGSVVMNPGSLASFVFALATPQAVGATFTATSTLTAKDASGNTITSFSAATDNVTITANGPLTGTVSGLGTGVNNVLNQAADFSSGVATLSAKMKYTGNTGTGTFTATSASGKTGTSGNVVVNPGTAAKFHIDGSATQTAGTSQNLTITALDAGGNTATGYTGSKSLTFSGANSSPSPVTVPTVENSAGTPVNFGTATAITFSSGVATVSAGNNGVMVLYKAESATISVTDGTINSSSGGNLAVTVNPAALGKFAFALATPQSNAAAFTGVNTLTAQDNWGNTVTAFDASASNVTITGVSPLTGTVSGLGTIDNNVLNQATDFSFGVANLTALGLTYTGASGTGTFTATSAGKTGTSGSVVMNPGSLASFVFALATPQAVGATFTATSTLTAKDVSGNTITTFSAATDNVTITANGPLTGTVSGLGTGVNNVLNKATDFSSGVATLSTLGMKYTGNTGTGTFTATSASGKTGTSGSVVMNAGTATQLKITGSTTQTAGTTQNLTITALDAAGNTATTYTGNHWLTFSGAHASPSPATNPTVANYLGTAVTFGSGEYITFSSGVATFSGGNNGVMTLYDVETATISVQESSTGSISSSGANNLAVTVSPGALGKFVFTLATPQINAAAFTGVNTLTAQDNWGNTVTAFDASASNVTITGVSPLTGTVSGLGTGGNNVLNKATDFSSGVANLTALGLTYTGVSGTGTFTATSAGKTGTSGSVVMNPGSLASFVFALATPQAVGVTFTATSTLTAKDVSGNTITTFNASTDNVTITANSPLTGTMSGLSGGNKLTSASDFSSGVATLSTLGMKYTGNTGTGTFTATSASGKTGTSGSVVINAGTATKLVITGSATQTAGTSQNLTITALDTAGNTATGYTGSKNLTFSGANSSPSPVTVPTVENSAGTPVNFGTATAITFSSGVATVSAGNNGVMVLYKAESATISATDGSISSSGSDRLAVTVNPAALGKFVFALATPQINAAAFTGVNTLTAQDNWGNTVTAFDASASNVTITGVSPLTGTVSGLGTVDNNVLNQATDFSSGVANLTALGLTYTGVSGTGTFTATSAGKTGTSGSVVMNPGSLASFVFALATPQAVGATFTATSTLTAKDVSGNTITTFSAATDNVTITANGPLTGTVSGLGTGVNNVLNQAADFSSGVATLSAKMKYTGNTGTGTFTATSASGKTGTSGNVVINAGVAAKLAFTTQPGGGTGGTAWATQPVVTVQDAGGNTITTDTSTITLAIANNAGPGGVLSGTSLSKAAVAGVASFSANALKIDKIGTGYTLTATDGALTSATSSPFNITVGPAAKLAFTTQPGGGTGGTAWTTQPVVTVQDAGGNTVTTDTSTITLAIANNAGPGGVLSGTLTEVAVAGVASFSGNGLSIDKIGTGYTLTATDVGLTSATSSAFNITVGPAAKLAFTTQPGGGTGGTAWTTQPVVTVQDAGGNTVTTDASTITVAIGTNPSGGTLSGTLTKAASSGVASFSANALKINLAGTGYTLTATDGALTSATSAAFNITVGTATKLVYTTVPSTGTAGTAFSVTVQSQDAGGNPANLTSATTITLSKATGGGTLSGTLAGSIAISANSVTIATPVYSKADTMTLTATASGGVTLTAVTSGNIVFSAGAAAKLAFTTQPGGGTAGTAWAAQPVVTVQDANGNTVATDTSSVTLAIGTNPGSGTLSGTKTVTAVAGVATFSGLNIDKAGTGYTLAATDNSLTGATSSGFNIVAAGQNAFRITAANGTPTAGASDVLTITAVDAYGNTITGYTSYHQITFSGLGTAPNGSVPTVTDYNGTPNNLGTIWIYFTSGQSSAGGTLVAYKAETATLAVAEGAYNSGGAGGTGAALTVSSATASGYRLSAATTTPQVGAADQLTIKLVDQYQNVVAGFNGDKSLTFSGLSASPSGTQPTVANKTGTAVNLGTATAITFASGQSSAGGILTAYKAEGPVNLAATDGTLSTATAGGAPVSLTVSAGAQTAFQLSATSGTPTAGATDALTIKAVDQLGNTVTSYTGSHNLTFSGLANAPAGTVPTVAGINLGTATAVTFANGVNSGTVNLVAYKAETATLAVTDGTFSTGGTGGTGAALTVGQAVASAYRLSAATTTPQVGVADQLTIIQVDAYQNVTALSGTKNLTFGGLSAGTDGTAATVTDNTGAAKNQGTATTITFASGTSSVGGSLVPHKAEGPVTLTATDGSLSTATTGGAPVSLTVSATSDSAYRITAATGTPIAGATDALTIKLVDRYQNVDTSFTGNKTLTFSGVTASPGGNIATVAGVNLGTGTTVAFVNGVSSPTVNLVAYDAGAATLTATDGTLSTAGTGGTGVALTVGVAAQSAFRIAAANYSPMAGASDVLTITMVDQYQNIVTGYTGYHQLTFSGLGTAPNGSSVPTVTDYTGTAYGLGTLIWINFASGQNSGTGGTLVAYKAETATLAVAEGTYNSGGAGGTGAALTVSSATASGYRLSAATTTPQVTVADQLTIKLVDQYQNVVAGFSGDKNLTFSGLSAGPSGTQPTVTDKTGAAVNLATATAITFANGQSSAGGILTAYKVEGPVNLAATDGTLSTATAGGAPVSLTVSAAAATKLVYTVVPSTGTAGTAFSVTVQSQDPNGNPVSPTSNTTITLSKASGGGTLTGTLTGTIPTSGNSVTISTPVYSKADTMTLTATATAGMTGLTPVTSGNIVFSAGTATKLVYTTVPATGTAGTAFSVTVQSQDANGNPANPTSNTTITLSKASGGGTLTGTLTGSISTGGNSVTIATPVYSKADIMTLKATATAGMTGLTPVTSGNIVFSAGLAAKLVMQTEPSATATAGVAFTTQPAVYIADANGNVVTTDGSVVSVALATGTGPLQGTLTATAVNGVATFTDLADNKAESITLRFTDGSLTAVTDGTTIVVSPATASQIHFVQGPPTTIGAGATMAPAVTVQVADVYNNGVGGLSVTMSLNGTGSLTGGGAQTTTAGTGVATFSGLSIDQTGSKTITATVASPSLSVTSGSFTVTAGGIHHYAVSAAPATRGSAFNVTVTAQDVGNNTVTTDSSTVVTLSASSANMLFDGNGDGSFNDNAKTLASGTFTISAKDNVAETVTVTATDGTGKTGNTSVTVNPLTGEYRSNASGNWNVNSTWQTWNGTAWVTASSTPSGAAGVTITIQSGHTVTDNVAVNLAGTLVVQGALNFSGGTLTVGSGGLIQNSGTISGTTSTLIFNSGGTYQHNQDDDYSNGFIPTATWNSGSTCAVIGYVNTMGNPQNYITSFSQSFANFTWNCPNQLNAISLGGYLTTARGDFKVISTGSGLLALGATRAGDLIIGGNFSQTDGTFYLSGGISRNVTVAGNFTMTGGMFAFDANGAYNDTFNVSVGGDFSHTGGTIEVGSDGGNEIANLVFNGTGTQTYTSGGTFSSAINFTVNSGATLLTGTSLVGNGSSGTFTLMSGATLGIGDPAGITTSGATGNIRVSSTRSYSTGANYIYNGTAAQVTGNGLPSPLNSLTINNTAGTVTLSQFRTVNTSVNLAGGAVLGLPSGTTSSAATLSIGGVTKASGTWGGTGSTALHLDSAHFAATTGLLNITTGGASTTTLTRHPGTSSPSTYGDSLSFDVVVAGAGGTPTGTVTLKDGSTVIGSGTLAGGSCTITPALNALAVGTHSSIVASYASDGNFNGSTSSALSPAQVVNPKTLTPSVTLNNKVYDRTTSATTIAGRSLAGILGSDDVNLGASGTVAAFGDKIVGSYTISVTGLSLSGATAGNYQLSSTTASASANITPKGVTITGVTAGNKPYDGNTTATLSGGAVSGVISPDVVTAVAGTGAFASRNVGTWTVTASGYSLGGTDAGNYTLAAQPTVPNASITARTLVVTATGQNKPYDGNATATVTLADNRVSGDTLTTSYTSATFADKNVGTGKTVTVTGIAVSGADAGNYTANTTTTTTANITAAGLTVTGITASNKVYDGNLTAVLTTTSAALAGVASGDNVTLSTAGATGAFANKNVGTGKTVAVSGLTISGGDAGNYTLTQPTSTANITPAPLTVTADDKSKVFGAPLPALTASYSGFAPGDTSSVLSGSPNLSTTATDSSPVGTYPITPVLGTLSAANYSFTTFNPGTLTVSSANSATVVTSSGNPSVTGQAVTFTATVSPVAPATGTPGGTVQFRVDGTDFGSPVTLVNGSATSGATSSLGVGTHTIAAIYSGNASFAGNTSPNFTQTVNKANTSTALASSANPSAAGQSVTFTATVTATVPGAGTPTGTVQFRIDGTDFGSPVTLSSGSATSGATVSLSGGNHTITAVYSGDAGFNSSTSGNFTQTVNASSVTATVGSSLNPSVYGQSVTFTATVSSDSGTPTGTVTFKDGAAVLGTVGLASGQATLTTTALGAAAHSITVVYNGDSSFPSTTSAALGQTVNKADTSATVASSVNPTVFGQPTTLTATVSVTSPGAGTPAGTVTFTIDGTPQAAAAVNGSGQATLSTAALGAGSHTVTATYNGDTNFNTSSGTLTGGQTVNKAGSSATIASSANPSCSGQAVTFTATVTPIAPASGTPTGTVSFNDGATTVATATLNGSGQATAAPLVLSDGPHSITAVYAGDANYNGASSAALSETINVAPVGGTATATATTVATGGATTITLSGYTGSIQWEYSTDGSNFTDISGQTGSTLNTGSLTTTIYFKARVTSGVCSPAYSSVATVTVTPASVGGTATAVPPAVNSGSPTTLTVSGSTGSIQWQSSLDGSTFSDLSGQTSPTFSSGPLTVTVFYRAKVTNGLNPPAYSSIAIVTINSGPAGDVATDVSSQVSVTRGGFGYNSITKRYGQTVTLKNTGATTVTGPVSLVLDSLSSNATLYNPAGTTGALPPNSPYVNYGSNLAPGASVAIGLQFVNPSGQGISYTTRVLAGAGSR